IVAQVALKALIASAPQGSIPRLAEATLDGRVLTFAIALGFLCALLSGLAPALRATRTDLHETLKTGGRGGGTRRPRLRVGLIVGEVALAVTLLAGAGLLIRSAMYLQRLDLGFDPTSVLAARVTLPGDQYADADRVVQTWESIVTRLEQSPGVLHAAVAS